MLFVLVRCDCPGVNTSAVGAWELAIVGVDLRRVNVVPWPLLGVSMTGTSKETKQNEHGAASEATLESASLDASRVEFLRRASQWVSVLAVAVALIGILTSVIGLVSARDTFPESPGLDIQLLRDIDRLKSALGGINKDLQEVSDKVAALSEPDEKTDISRQVGVLRSQLQEMQNNIKVINDAIIEDPAKALTVPMLRNDLAELEEELTDIRTAAAKDIDRIYDQNKWFIGLMLTMAVGFVGLAISNFVQIGVSRKAG